MNSNFACTATCAPSFGQSLSQHAASGTFQDNVSTHPSNVSEPLPLNSVRAVQEENRQLKADVDYLKQLIQNITIDRSNSSSADTTPGKKARKPQKSITPKMLNKSKLSDHNQDKVELSHVSQRLLTSCYDLARCLMNRESATSPIPDPPTTHKWRQVEGYFEVVPNGPADSAGSWIQ
ncbi:hypothetical protein PCANC_20662 [Puccinia coronata f. sp. avenae]|uniref:Uncharacterized protein n=1 Tax=Puccinia coronata f. sp. avenae TaxID=200324 RepID=A0A2N5UQ05_9BASI|nr:hypothetical protein PCANC_20662 [Puccinia coronata f. sp. avenae]